MKPFRPPVQARVTRALIVANVAVQLLLTLAGPATANAAILYAGLIPARVTGAAELPGAVPALLTPLTSIFLHDGWLHLAMNLVFLGLVGRFVEWALGARRFTLLFLAGGIVGSFAQVLAAPTSPYPAIGASGAISAIFGCYAVLFARRRLQGRRLLGRAWSAEALTALWFAAIWIGIQLLVGFVAGIAGFGIAIWAHIGGFLVGLAYAQPYVRARRF